MDIAPNVESVFVMRMSFARPGPSTGVLKVTCVAEDTLMSVAGTPPTVTARPACRSAPFTVIVVPPALGPDVGLAEKAIPWENSDVFPAGSVAVAVMRVAADAAEMLGGIAYVSNETVSYLLAAVRCLAFHPPSKAAVEGSLDKYLAGEPFRFV